jgi:hypothetical protein
VHLREAPCQTIIATANLRRAAFLCRHDPGRGQDKHKDKRCFVELIDLQRFPGACLLHSMPGRFEAIEAVWLQLLVQLVAKGAITPRPLSPKGIPEKVGALIKRALVVTEPRTRDGRAGLVYL